MIAVESNFAVLNYIEGKRVPAQSGSTLPCFEPATGKVYGTVPDSDAHDVQAAVAAAVRAFPGWSATPVVERSRLLRRLGGAIRENLEALARAESVDSGKPLSLARSLDIPRSAQNFEFFADAMTQFASEAHSTDGHAINYTVRSPIGVVGCISPWNLPLYLLSWKIAPALAAGNCVVAKPSEVTPATADWLARLAIEVGFPPGVLNIVHGLGPKVGAAMSAHPDIKAISFTGSTMTGSAIAQVAAPQFKKLSLELGGKNATVVFADCDFEAAVATTVRAAFTNQGQICLCGSRIFVERKIYDRFKAELVKRTLRLQSGDPMVIDPAQGPDQGPRQGAVVSKAHYDKIIGYLEVARAEGGVFLTGGKPASVPGRCAEGWFIEPTLIEGLGSDCRINQEEVFGPVATLIPFDQEAELIEWVNSTRYGLSASVWTQDVSRAHRVAALIQTGIVWVNCWLLRDLRTPFGGMKESGVGREGGWEALRFFTEPKNVCVKYGGQ